MVFVLDNYDSFTYNLVQYIGELGAKVEVSRNDQITIEELEAMHPERIVVSPGPCTPHEAGISIELIRHFAGKVPVLGVCLGTSSYRRSIRWAGGAGSAADARQDQPRDARQQDRVSGPSHADDRHPLPLAHRGRERPTFRTASECMDD